MKRAALLLVAGLLAAAPASALADQQSYALAIQQARSLVEEGLHGRSDAAQRALAVLVEGTGDTQPAILEDLRDTPPNLQDADIRLGAVAAAMARPGDVGNPGFARSQLHSVLSQSRYDGLHANQSPWDRFWNWLLTQFVTWLSSIPFGALPGWVAWALVGLLGLVTAGVAALIARTGWSRAAKTLQAVLEGAPARPVDHFAAADAAAARADWTAALRSLVAGVATSVSGQPYWESSPLTVRELFRSSGELDKLRPLLLAFEGAVYGFRPIDEAGYRRLAELAEPYRQPRPEEAAA